MSGSAEFFEFAKERYRIFLRKERGDPGLLTLDPILRRHRFCNVFREDDKVSRWFSENIRSKVARKSQLHVLEAVAGFRWFNRIETGELIKSILVKEGWNSEAITKVLDGVSPICTGAYMIRSPRSMKKLPGICHAMNGLVERKIKVKGMTLQEAHAKIMDVPYLGFFTAYEIVTDLRHTPLLSQATDINTWAAAGPGAARGLGWIHFGEPKGFAYQGTSGQSKMLPLMRELLDMSDDPSYWPHEWPEWEMREVEHTLCEYDKWKRGSGGQRLKRNYP